MGVNRLTPVQITLLYGLFGSAFLIFSDAVLPRLVTSPDLLRELQAVKGAVEILLTAGLIFLLTTRMETQLQQSEQRYRNLIETSPVPINLFDEDGRTVWSNDAVLDLLGLDDRDELVGRSIFDFIHPDDRTVAEGELVEIVGEDASTGPTDMRLQRADGEIRHIRVSTAPGRFGGERIGQAVVVDVTELRRIEAELRAERNFIRNALDELRDVFFVLDADGNLKRWNSRLADVTGYTDEQLGRMHASTFVEGEDVDRIEEAIRTTLEEGSSFLEADLVTSDDERLGYEFKGARLSDPDRGTQVVGIGRDVTERRRMERELRENEQRYRTLVEMSPDSILVHRDGEVVFANDAMVDLVGAEAESVVQGASLTTYLHPDEHEDVLETAARTQRGLEQPTDTRRTLRTTEGEERHIETTSRPIAYEGEPAVLTVVKDVTHHHRYEQMLTTLHERSRAMTRAEGRTELADIAVQSTDDLVGLTGTAVYEFDGDTTLSPLAWSECLADADGQLSGPSSGDGDLWECFVDGQPRRVELETGRAALPGTGNRTVFIRPLGNHGLLTVVGDTGTTLSTTQENVLNLVTENLDAAFDRAEREENLRERDRRLAEQNEALEQLNRLNEIIRQINQALVRSSTKTEVMARACDQLAAAEQYAMAWTGTQDAAGDVVAPEHWSGMDAEYVDAVGSMPPDSPLQQVLADAIRENEVQVAGDILSDPAWEAHRRAALNQGYRSVAVVPIATGEHVESVLVIHARETGIFDERERTVLEELGETIGYALRTIDRTAAIQSDERTEVELAIDDEQLFTNRATSGLDARLSFVGAIADESDSLRIFLRLAGEQADEAAVRLDSLETVTECQPLSLEDGDGGGAGAGVGLYQLRVAPPPLMRILQRTGTRIGRLDAEDGTTTVVGILPGDVRVRPFVEELQEAYPGTTLRARREDATPVDTRETFRDRLLDQLTDRQREALQTAYYSGFYAWPRELKSQELASMLDIASSTYQYHLRAAERQMVGSVLDPA